MSVEQTGSGAAAAAIQELTRLEQHAAQARKVLVICGAERPGLLTKLRDVLQPIGIDCVEIEPRGQEEYFEALPAAERIPIQSFAELLASPQLAPLMSAPGPSPISAPQGCILLAAEPAPAPDLVRAVAYASVAETVTEQGRSSAPAEPEPPLAPTKRDMTRPENWGRGDVFTESPKFCLPHQQREWFLTGFDGVDVEIERVNAHRTELLTLEHFKRRYVFVRHAETAEPEPAQA
jgi:hypothetical protein